jgi:hypothetical protein
MLSVYAAEMSFQQRVWEKAVAPSNMAYMSVTCDTLQEEISWSNAAAW